MINELNKRLLKFSFNGKNKSIKNLLFPATEVMVVGSKQTASRCEWQITFGFLHRHMAM